MKVGRAARMAGALALLAALLTVPSPPAAAEQGSFGPGHHYVADALVIGPDDTFVLGPGTSLTGPGSLDVLGRLEIRGEADRPAQIALPVRLRGDHPHVIAHARLWGVNGTAVSLEKGALRLDDVLFEAGQTGLDLVGPVLAEGRNVTFRAHGDAGLSVGAYARASLDHARLEDNAVGARVLPGGTLRLADLAASGNRVHVSADLAPADTAAPDVQLLDATLGPAGAAAVRAHAATPGPPGAAPNLLLSGGRVHGAPVAIEAHGLRVRVENATLEDNAVGLALAQAVVELRDVHLGNARDWQGAETSRLLLDNVTYRAAASAPAAAARQDAAARGGLGDAWPWWVPWLAMAGVLLIAGAILWTGRAARLAPAPVPATPAAPPAQPAQPAPEGDASPEGEPLPAGPADPAPGAEMGLQERRVLEDILAHPDTAQAAVAERLGLSRQAVHYHVKKLESKGLIRKTTRGRETQCRAEPGAAAALAAASAKA